MNLPVYLKVLFDEKPSALLLHGGTFFRRHGSIRWRIISKRIIVFYTVFSLLMPQTLFVALAQDLATQEVIGQDHDSQTEQQSVKITDTPAGHEYAYIYTNKTDTKILFEERATKRPGFALENASGEKQASFLLADGLQTMDDKAKGVEVSGTTISFPVTISDIPMTLRYTVTDDSVKEEFIIHKKPSLETLKNLGEKLRIPFTVEKNNLSVKKEGSEYVFYSPDEQVVWRLPQPVVTDAGGDITPISLDMDVISASQATITVPSSYLEHANYPIAIDPTVITSAGTQPTKVSTQRKIVRTTDGTLHAFVNTGSVTMDCGGSAKGGLLWISSSDNGTTWVCQSQLSTSTSYVASAVVDTSDNIYLTYAEAANGASSSRDLFYRKLTENGSSWTVESAQTILDSTGTTGYSYPSIALESGTRLWLAFRYYDGTNYQVMTYYSDGFGAAPTWTQSSGLDTAGSTNTEHIPQIIRYGTNIGVFYSSGISLKWRFRSDGDGLTSWNSEADAIAGTSGVIQDKFSVAVDNNNHLHAAALLNSASTAGVVRYRYYDGASWATAIDLASSTVFGSNLGSPQVTTDGTSVWVFWVDRTGIQGASDVGKIVYKKGVSPFASGDFDASSTSLNTSDRTFDKVWLYDLSANTYEDETTDAASTGASGDISHSSSSAIVKDNDDAIYLGMTETYRFVNLGTSTNGVGGVVAYEYWNGSSWTALSTVGSANANFTSCTSTGGSVSCGVWFTPPTDWAKTTINGESAPGYYYVRARVTTGYSTAPVGTQARAVGRIDSISTIAKRSGQLNIIWADTLNGTTPMNIQSAVLLAGGNVEPDNPSSLGGSTYVDGSFHADTTPTLSFTLTDANGSDQVQYQIQIDDSANFGSPVVDYTSALAAQGSSSFTVGQAAGSGTYTTGSASTTLGDGSYYWRVKAVDNSGLESAYTSANSGGIAFNIDATAPTTPGSPSVTTGTSDNTPSWTWTASSDSGSGLAANAYTIEWSDDNFSTVTDSSATTTNSFTHSLSLADGTWYVRVSAIDAVGNISSVSSIGSVTINTSSPNTLPDTPSSLGPTGMVNGSYGTDTTPAVSFTLSDPDGSDQVRYQVQIDDSSNFGSPVVDYTSALAAQGSSSFTVGQAAGSGTYTTGSAATTLGDGSYYWRVKAVDASASSSAYMSANSGSIAFYVDTTAPTTPGTPSPAADPTNDTTPTWTWTAASDSGSGLANPAYTVQWSDDNFSSVAGTATTNSNTYTNLLSLSDGTWYFRVSATDSVGNTSSNSSVGTVVINSGSGTSVNHPSSISSTSVQGTRIATQKKIVRTTDGTLHTFVNSGSTIISCAGSSKSGLVWLRSSDNGVTWTCEGQLYNSTAYVATAVVDSADNIYLLFGVSANGGSTSNDIYYRKLTRTSSTWTMTTSAQLVLDAATTAGVTTGYSDPVIEVEGTSRAWMAVRYFDGTNYQVVTYYTNGLTDTPTWTQSTVMDSADTSTTSHIPTIVRFGTKIGVLYTASAGLKWRYRADTDGLTSWNSEADVVTGASISDKFSATVDNSNNIHVAAMVTSTSTSGIIRYTYYNGSAWASSIDLASSNVLGSTFGTVQMVTDGTAVWVIWGDRTNFYGPSEAGRLVYKKGVSPFGSGDFDVSATAIHTDERTYDKVWVYSSTAGTYEDETADAASGSSTGDIAHSSTTKMVDDTNDALYVGMSETSRFVNVGASTNGIGGVVAYEYWNGSTWTTLSTVGTSTNANFTSCTGTGGSVSCGVWFTPPADWAKTTVNGESAPGYYYVRARVTTGYSTAPVGTQARAIGRLDNVSAIAKRAGMINLVWSENFNGTTPFAIRSGSFLTGGNIEPDNPTSLGASSYVDGSYNADTTPTLSFTLSDQNSSDQLRYRVQVYTNIDFASNHLVVDYTSALGSQGARSFTLGESGGTYAVGNASTTLTDGNYYWQVKTIDASGSESGYTKAASGALAFQIDTVAPTTPGTPAPASSPTNDTTPSWTWTAATDSASGLATNAYSVQWSTTSNFSVVDGSSTTTTNSFTHSVALTDNTTWYFRVAAVDTVGNTSAWSTTGSVDINASLPNSPSSLGSASYVDGSYNTDITPTLTFSVSAPNGGDQLRYQIQIATNSAFTSQYIVVDYTSALAAQGSKSFTVGQAAGTGTYTTGSASTTLTDRAYYWRVKAINSSSDATGYVTANPTGVSFYIDTTAPTTPGTPTPASDPTSDTTPSWTWTASTDAGSGLAASAYTLQWSNNGFSTITGTTTTSTNAYTHSVDLANGTWSMRVYATDAVGNQSSPVTGTVVVNTNLPVSPTIVSYDKLSTGQKVANNPGEFLLTMPAGTKYHIQIASDSGAFSNNAIDYTSVAGSRVFYIGMAAGSGTYTKGSSNTLLLPGNYYWRVRTINPADPSVPSAWTVANAGNVAFVIDNSITPATMNLTATYNNINIELFYTGDSNHDATATVQYKKSSDSIWKDALPLWQVDNTIGNNETDLRLHDSYTPGFYGSIVTVDSATTYDVRVTVTDPAGVNGTTTYTQQVTTRTDAIPSISSYTPDTNWRYVAPGGNDQNDGLSEATPWKTVAKALQSAPSGGVIQLAPGYYEPSSYVRKQPVIIHAKYPAVDDNRNEINLGQHSIIGSTIVVGPTGSSDAPYSASTSPWVQETVTGTGKNGAPAGAEYTVWKWTGTPTGALQQYGYASSMTAAPQRVVHWDNSNSPNNTVILSVADWAELMYTNQTQNYGFFQNIKGADYTVYVRLPHDRNPNNYYINMGGSGSNNGYGIMVKGPNVRIHGIEFRYLNTSVYFGGTNAADSVDIANTTDGIFDHNLVIGAMNGIGFFGIGKREGGSAYPERMTIEKNRFIDTNLWAQNTPSQDAVSWYFVKEKIIAANGLEVAQRLGGMNETTAVFFKAGAKHTVIRHNTIDGYFNGVSAFDANGFYDRHDSYGADIHDNYLVHGNDDAFEPEGTQANWHIYNNTIEYFQAVLSVSPVMYGPIYLFKNSAYRTGVSGSPEDSVWERPVAGGNALKLTGGIKNPNARVFVINNTFWSDETDPHTNDISKKANSGNSPSDLYMRNNLFRATRYAFEIPDNQLQLGRWDEDYNEFSGPDGIKINGLNMFQGKPKTSTEYQATGYAGVHSNRFGDMQDAAWMDNNLANPVAGDLSLSATSVFIDQGTVVPNIADTFSGSAPDLGYQEYGDGSVTPTPTPSNSAPNIPSSLGATAYVNGSFGTDTTPTLSFTLTDANGSDQVRYQIQIDDSANFGSPVVDYTSALAAQGSSSFTVGQAAGSGTYTTGSASTTLADGSYYWRVKAIDATSASSAYTTANSGNIAFGIDTTAPTVPGTPTNTTPTSNIRPLWVWNSSLDTGSGVASYTIQWSTDVTFTTVSGSATVGTNTYTHTVDLSNGTWYARVSATDALGNISSYSSIGSAVVDTALPNSAPDLPSSLGPTAMVNGSYGTDTTPGVTFTLSDPDGSDQVQYQIQIDDSANFGSPVVDYTSALAAQGSSSFTVGQAAGSGTYTTGSASTTLVDGSYYWRVKAVDASASSSAYMSANSGSIAFHVDTTAPTTPGIPAPAADPTNDTTPTWTWTASSDSGSGVSSYTIEWSKDNTFGTASGSATLATNTYTHTSSLSDGIWYMRVKATDAMNNMSSYSANGSVTIDTTAPTVPTAVSSSDHTPSTWSGDATITMIWTAATDASTSIAGYSYLFDTLSNTIPDTTQDIGAVTTITSSAVTDGNTHYFHIRAVDALGNWGNTVHVGPYYIDTTGPTKPGTPTTTSPTSNARPNWTWTASVDTGAGLSVSNAYTVQWSDDAGFSSATTSSTSSAFFKQPSNLADGTWYFRVQGVDSVGNTSTMSNTGIVIVDSALGNSAPDLPTNLGGTNGTNGSVSDNTTPTVSFTLSDPDISDTLKFRIQIFNSSDMTGTPVIDYVSAAAAQGERTFTVGQAAGSGTYTYGAGVSSLSDGTYYWQVKAIDTLSAESDFNAANSGDAAFVIDATAPSVPENLTTESPTGTSFPEWSWGVSTDTTSSIDFYTIQWCGNSAFTGCAANIASPTATVYASESSLSDGTWYFRVKATDAAGNVSAYGESSAVVIDTTAPTTPGTPSPAADPTNDTTPTWTWTASVDGGVGLDTYTVAWCTSTDFSNCTENTEVITTNTYTLPSAAEDGTWYLKVYAQDSVGNVSPTSANGSVTIDTTAPVFSGLGTAISSSAATIQWTTNENATTQLNYGLTSSYSETTGEVDTLPGVTSHAVSLSDLVPCTLYYYQLVSKDALENQQTSAGSFITTGCVGSATVLFSTSENINPSSGGDMTLLSAGKGVGLTVPSGATPTDTSFQLKQMETAAVIQAISQPAGVLLATGHIYDLEALSDLATVVSSFTQPLTITIYYQDADIAGIQESSLKIYQYHNGVWSPLSSCSVNTAANTVSCSTTEFSIFGLFGTVGVTTTQSNTTSPSSSSSSPDTYSSFVCTTEKPSAAPYAFQAKTTNSAATIFFAPAGAPYSSYTIRYGTKRDEYPYAVTFEQGYSSGVIAYTINALARNTNYYFTIAANNGCMGGDYGNVLGAKTTNKVGQVLTNHYSAIASMNGMLDKQSRSTVKNTPSQKESSNKQQGQVAQPQQKNQSEPSRAATKQPSWIQSIITTVLHWLGR